MSTIPDTVDVLIIGGGPTGLSLASSLLNKGVRPEQILVVDKQVGSKPKNESRALVIHAHTLELLSKNIDGEEYTEDAVQRYGDSIVDVSQPLPRPLLSTTSEITKRAFLSRDMTIWEKGRPQGPIAKADFSSIPSRHRYATLLGQAYTEDILLARLETLGGKVQQGWTVQDVVKDEKSPVDVTLKHEDGSIRKVRCQVIVAADGGHSLVRQKSDIAYRGGRFPGTFFIADILVREKSWPFAMSDDEKPTGGLGVFSENGALYMLPLPGGAFRIAASTGFEKFQDSKREESGKEDTGGHLQQSVTMSKEQIQKVLDLLGPTVDEKERPNEVVEVKWASAFHISHRIADTMFKDRTIVCGDACHTHSPAGGQGMNAGITDAIGASLVLAPALLDGSLQSNWSQVSKDLTSWSDQRLVQVRRIAATSNSLHKMSGIQGKWSNWLRVTILRLFAPFVVPGMAKSFAGV